VDAGEVKKRLGIHPYAPMVLFTGRMSYQKGADMLVNAIPEILNNRWDTRFVFVGDGGMRQYCKQCAAQCGVPDAGRFLGRVSDETLSDCMNACDLACVPSRNEPFGIVVLEAWDAAKPVIATDAVHLIDNFSNGITGYKHPESIAWCLNYSMGDLESTKKMGQNGKKLVETKYNWDRIADDTVKVYRKLEG
jgi:glycosyltransferase involved in cell wall biosynthesis